VIPALEVGEQRQAHSSLTPREQPLADAGLCPVTRRGTLQLHEVRLSNANAARTRADHHQ